MKNVLLSMLCGIATVITLLCIIVISAIPQETNPDMFAAALFLFFVVLASSWFYAVFFR